MRALFGVMFTTAVAEEICKFIGHDEAMSGGTAPFLPFGFSGAEGR